jgi:prevent-host-death family protein
MEITMREIGAFEARNKLGALLDWVAAGEEVLITRRGKAVARLVPAEHDSIVREPGKQRVVCSKPVRE